MTRGHAPAGANQAFIDDYKIAAGEIVDKYIAHVPYLETIFMMGDRSAVLGGEGSTSQTFYLRSNHSTTSINGYTPCVAKELSLVMCYPATWIPPPHMPPDHNVTYSTSMSVRSVRTTWVQKTIR